MKKTGIEKKIVLIFLLFTAFFTLFRSSMSGIFSLFYANNGIPDSSISSIKSFQSIGILIGLLPSGYLSDKVGRLKVLNLSALIISISFLLLILFRNVTSFSLAEFLYGIGLAFNSGTLLSYITELQEQHKIQPDAKLMGRQVIVLNLATLIGGNIGTYLFGITNTAPIWFALIGLGLYPVFVISVIKYFSLTDNKAEHESTKTIMQKCRNLLSFFSKRNFWILLLLNAGYDCGTQFILIYWSIIYVDKLHFNLSLVYTLFMCSLLLGSAIFDRIVGFLDTKLLVILNTCLMISLFTLSSCVSNRYILLALFLLIELLMGMMSGQISATSNTSIYGEKNKSMMLSAVSFAAEILVSISLFVSDLIIKSAGNIIVMYIVSAFYFAIILFTVPLIRKKEY